MARRKDDGLIDAAKRRRDQRCGKRGQARGHAGHDSIRDAGRGQRNGFVTAASKNQRIAALEPQHPTARTRQLDEPVGNFRLTDRRLSAALADVLQLRLRAGERQHAGIDQCVVQDDVGLNKSGNRIEREQTRVTRPGAGEPDMARRQERIWTAQRSQGVELVHDRSPRNRRR